MTLPSDVNNVNSVPPTAENARGSLLPQPMFPPPVSGTFTPPALAVMPDALSLLKALRRRLVPALIVGLILAAIVGGVTWTLIPPPKIAARTQLYVALMPPSILFNERNTLNNETFLRSQAYLIKDRFLLNAVLRDNPELAELSILKQQPEPLQWLENQIMVSFPSPEVMHISLSGDQPEEQKKIVSAVTKTYLETYVNKERTDFLAHQQQLKDLLISQEDRTKHKRDELRHLQEGMGAMNEEGMVIFQKIALDDLRAVRRDLTKVHQDLRALQIELDIRPDWIEQIWPRYAALLNGLPGPGLPINHAVVGLLHDEALMAMASPAAAPPQLERVIDEDPKIQELKRRILEQRETIARTKEAMISGPRKEARLKAESNALEKLKKSENALREALRPSLLGNLRQKIHAEGISSRAERWERYRLLRLMEQRLLQEVAQLDEDTKQIKKQAVDLVQRMREIEQDEKVMNKASERIKHMEVEQGAPQRITQPDKEAVLYTPDAAKRKAMMTAGAAAAVLGLVLLAFAWFEFQSRKVHSIDEVVHGLGLNLVGTVPDPSPRGWRPWSWGGDNSVYAQSMLTESVDAARTQLLHVARQEKLQIVMITSALAGEGKTSLASHLAASLARAGRRTILVDSDLRNPTLHRLFERSRAPGLSELLRGEADLATVCRDTPIGNLWLISAGKADASALQALAFDSIPKLFEQLRPHYDFIIVDSCPVLPVADSLLVGQHVDAVIFSLLRQVSRLPRVYAAYQRLSLLGIRMLGAVVNGTSHDLYPADYNYIGSESESD